MSDQLKILAQLEKLRSLKSQLALADIQRQEARIREKISVLNEHRRQSHSTDTELVPMRAIGADVQWQAWIDRTQSELTIDLARLLVRKEPVMKKAKIDMARKETAQELTVQTEQKRQSEDNSKRLQSILEMATISQIYGR